MKQKNRLTESPDEYPSSSSTTPVGRRGSYKTGRGWCWINKIYFTLYFIHPFLTHLYLNLFS